MRLNDYKIFLSFSLVVLAFGLWLFVFVASAMTEGGITFPVAELGNCESKAECKAYCDRVEHIKVCVAFAREHNLMSQKEAERAEKFAEVATQAGPGGCQGKEACEAYCESISHIRDCIAFGEAHGFIPPSEAKEAKQVAAALEKGVKLPGNCQLKSACEAYCHEDTHMEECVAFAREAGFMSEEEYEIVKKTGGKGPGNCRGKEACEAYCEEEGHFEGCMSFAKAHGLIGEKEAEIAQKTGGKGPGGCRGKTCETYCEEESHFEECLAFGKQHGLISDEEYEAAKKTGGKGPGDCRGEACKAYCEKPEHREECMQFARDHGLINGEKEQQQTGEGQEKFQEMFSQMPPHVKACLEEQFGEDVFEKMQKGEFRPNNAMEEAMRNCFEQRSESERPQGEEGEHSTGPGGCKGEEECRRYCSDPAHREECGIPPFHGGETPHSDYPLPSSRERAPGGCTTPEECQAYCREHPQECGFAPPPTSRAEQEQYGQEQQEYQQQEYREEEYQPQSRLSLPQFGAFVIDALGFLLKQYIGL